MANFIYLNVNPDNTHSSDCVTRAISLASGLSYPEIRRKLFHSSKLLNCEKLCSTCYSFLIEHILKCRPIKCDNMTVREFADLHPYGIYLVRMAGHISTIINGDCYDIWNCLDQKLTNSWKVK